MLEVARFGRGLFVPSGPITAGHVTVLPKPPPSMVPMELPFLNLV